MYAVRRIALYAPQGQPTESKMFLNIHPTTRENRLYARKTTEKIRSRTVESRRPTQSQQQTDRFGILHAGIGTDIFATRLQPNRSP